MSVNTKMTALANEIRELSGTTTSKGIDVMTSDIDAANTEIAGQTELIAQITTALEGKAGGASNGIEYEIITIPEGATSASYTLSRVTNAYGGASPGYALDEDSISFTSPYATHICDNLIYGVLEINIDQWQKEASVYFESVFVYYNQGTITWSDFTIKAPITLLLINDPNLDEIA